MSSIEQMIAHVIDREGGYVNNSSDRGGPTKYGITLATLHDWRKCPVSLYDVQQLTVDEATKIYRKRYFDDPGISAITDQPVLEELFDYGITSGPGTAVKALQKALDVPTDGAIGPVTLRVIRNVTNWPALFWRIKAERLELVLRYIGRDPSQSIFADGWANRFDQLDMLQKAP